MIIIKLKDAIINLKPIINKPFGEFLEEEEMKNIRTNKGLTGQLLEIQLGLKNTSLNMDFEDGELKSNKVELDGDPIETMYIKQISNMVDDILNRKEFYSTKLYYKIQNLLYVPVYKGSRKKRVHKSEWRLLPYIHINLDNYPEIINQLEKDYYTISKKMNTDIQKGEDGFIHTSNGKYIQIRTKDSKPYNPIYSNKYNRPISDKNYAFYFRKPFMRKLQEISPKYPIN